MKKTITRIIMLALIGLSHFTNAQSPNWLWAKRMSGASSDVAQSSAIDPTGSGALYTTGYFTGTVDFDPGSGVFNLTAAGLWDIFISKLDGSGNFVWAKAIGGPGNHEGVSIAIEPASRAIYTTGFFSATVDFDPGVGVFNLTSAGSGDIFISKLDSSGNFVWAKQMGGTAYDKCYSIAIDTAGSGDIYTTGVFEGTADFDPGPGTFNLSPAGSSDIFISKLDSSGNFVWAKRMGGTDLDYGQSIAIDPGGSGDVYTTGYFPGTVDFDPGPGAAVFFLTSAGGTDIFISKLDASGNFVWAKRMGGPGNDMCYSLTIDPTANGDIYTTGYFVGTVDFDPGAGVFNLTTAGFYDIFISKLDASGNFVWAKRMGGAGWDYGLSIATDHAGSGAVYTTGSFMGIADLDPGAGVFNLTAAGGPDIFISKLDASGNFVWAKAMGGTSDDSGNSITLDASGHVHVAGDFDSPTISFGSTTLTNAGGKDIFIARLDTAIITGNNEIENSGKGVLVFPNPATNLITIALGSNNQKVAVTIADITGKIIYSTTASHPDGNWEQNIEVNTKDFSAGIYVVRIQSADFIATKKLVVEK